MQKWHRNVLEVKYRHSHDWEFWSKTMMPTVGSLRYMVTNRSGLDSQSMSRH